MYVKYECADDAGAKSARRVLHRSSAAASMAYDIQGVRLNWCNVACKRVLNTHIKRANFI